MFLFYLIQVFALFSCKCARFPFYPPPPSHAPTPPLLSPCPPMTLQSSLNFHQPPHQHQSQQIKVSSCPFFPTDTRCRQTDPLMSAFIPCLGDKIWHISPHTPSVTPFVTPCIFLYEITVLIGEIVVYGRGLEFQEIMEGVLCTNVDRKSLENGEQLYLQNDYIYVWTMKGRFIVSSYG